MDTLKRLFVKSETVPDVAMLHVTIDEIIQMNRPSHISATGQFEVNLEITAIDLKNENKNVGENVSWSLSLNHRSLIVIQKTYSLLFKQDTLNNLFNLVLVISLYAPNEDSLERKLLVQSKVPILGFIEKSKLDDISYSSHSCENSSVLIRSYSHVDIINDELFADFLTRLDRFKSYQRKLTMGGHETTAGNNEVRFGIICSVANKIARPATVTALSESAAPNSYKELDFASSKKSSPIVGIRTSPILTEIEENNAKPNQVPSFRTNAFSLQCTSDDAPRAVIKVRAATHSSADSTEKPNSNKIKPRRSTFGNEKPLISVGNSDLFSKHRDDRDIHRSSLTFKPSDFLKNIENEHRESKIDKKNCVLLKPKSMNSLSTLRAAMDDFTTELPPSPMNAPAAVDTTGFRGKAGEFHDDRKVHGVKHHAPETPDFLRSKSHEKLVSRSSAGGCLIS